MPSPSDPASPDGRPVVAVVGAGITGLAAARVLAGGEPASDPGDGSRAGGRSGPRPLVVVLEASDEEGGNLRSEELDGLPVDLGPDQFLRRDPSGVRLCELLGLSDGLVAPGAASAACWSRGALRRLPAGLVLGVPTDLDALGASGLVSDEGLARARRDLEAKGPPLTAGDVGLDQRGARSEARELSAGEILRPRLGDEVVDRVVDPLLGGINAGRCDLLSLGVTAPAVASALVGHHDVIAPLAAAIATRPRVPGSAFSGLKGGLRRIVAACAAELHEAGAELRTRSEVVAIAEGEEGLRLELREGRPLEADGVVLALPGHGAARLLAGPSPEAARQLQEVPYASVVTVTFLFAAEGADLPPGSTGFLVPRVEGRLTTAVSWISTKWPSAAPAGKRVVRVSAGRDGDTRPDDLDDGELEAALLAELRELGGIASLPEASVVSRFPRALPQYRPGHRALVGRVEGLLSAVDGVELAGPVLGGIGLPACVRSGEEAAGRLLATLGR